MINVLGKEVESLRYSSVHMYIHQKLELRSVLVQKFLYNFKINAHSIGLWNQSYFIAMAWHKRKLVNNFYLNLELNYLYGGLG